MVNIGESRSITDRSDKKYGFAGGIDYKGEFSKYNFTGSNYFSTSFYPGDKQGAVNVYQRLSSRPGKSGRYWVFYNFNSYSPKQLPGRGAGYLRTYSFTKTGAGYSYKKNRYSFSLQPQWNREKNNLYNFLNEGKIAELQSYDLDVQFNIAEPVTGKYLSVSSTAGFIKTDGKFDGDPVHIKTHLSWRYRDLYLHASWQSGCFYLSETASFRHNNNDNNFRQVHISPGISKSILQNRIKVNLGFSWAQGSRFGRNILINAGIKFNPVHHVEVFSEYLHQDYSQSYSDINNLQAGVRILTPPLRTGEKSHDLQVRLFKDLNNNGYYDEGDIMADKFPLSINGVPFMSDNRGIVRYKNLPEGEYVISFKPDNGWYGNQLTVDIHENKNILIPLKRSGELKGRIVFHQRGNIQNLKNEINLKNIQIKASDPKGKDYYTLTDKSGSFNFHLPAGVYRVEMVTNIPEVTCLNRDQQVIIIPDESSEVNYIIEMTEKKREIIRFTNITENRDN
jgi:hypothetical protein